jgi:seryl-tRNA synthetase
MSEDMEKAVREELEQAAKDQEAIQERLKFLLARLPPSPREDVMLTGEEDYDFPTEVRTALECILVDWIGSAIRDLHDLARYHVG